VEGDFPSIFIVSYLLIVVRLRRLLHSTALLLLAPRPMPLWSFAAMPSIMAGQSGWAEVGAVIASFCHDSLCSAV